MFKTSTIFLLVTLGLLEGKPASSDSTSGKGSKGLAYYESIIEKHPDMPEARFGAGHSAYVMGDYDRALSEFQSVLGADDVKLRSKSYYNLGNTLYQQGKLEESMAAYRKALELDPRDLDTKYNYELTRKRMQQLQNKQHQSESDRSKERKESPQEKKNQQSRESEKPENQPQNDQSQPRRSNNDEEQEAEQYSQQRQAQEEQERPDAESILNALKADEKNLMKRRLGKAQSRKLAKDW